MVTLFMSFKPFVYVCVNFFSYHQEMKTETRTTQAYLNVAAPQA